MIGESSRRFVTISRPQLPPGAVAICVHGSLGHTQLAGDLFGAQMPVDQTQTLALSRGQAFDSILGHGLRLAHRMSTLAVRGQRRLDSIVKS
jgi:hypothetical protein